MVGLGIGCLETLFPVADALAIWEFVHKCAAVFIVRTNIFMRFKMFLLLSLFQYSLEDIKPKVQLCLDHGSQPIYNKAYVHIA